MPRGRPKNPPAPYDPAYSRYLLRRAGLNQSQLAEELNISKSSVSFFLDGKQASKFFWDYFCKRIQHVVAKAS